MDLERALARPRTMVDDAIRGEFDGIQPDELREATRWYPDAGGKRLRPAMALLACEAADGRAEDALPLAMAVELVHNFSLVHDDIMDRDATRRGRATVHVKWGEPTAILAGDVLFARAFEVLARIPDPRAHRDAAALLARCVLGLCEGQALDMAFEARETVTVDDYVRMVRLKTGLLFEAATRGGALLGKDPRAVEALATFGDAFGVAFQVADDLLDATGDEKTLGKPWGSDVRAGKRTILVLGTLERGNEAQRTRLLRVLGRRDASDDEVRDAVAAMREAGAIARAQTLRDDEAARADAALATLSPTQARDALRALNRWAVTRRA